MLALLAVSAMLFLLAVLSLLAMLAMLAILAVSVAVFQSVVREECGEPEFETLETVLDLTVLMLKQKQQTNQEPFGAPP